MTAAIHPWNLDKAARIVRDRERMPHALLLAGARGLGKSAFAEWLARMLLCAQPSAAGEPCGRCQSCHLFAAGTHPDLHVVQSEAVYKAAATPFALHAMRYAIDDRKDRKKDSSVIQIAQVRALIESSQTRPQLAGCKVLVLSPADSMNVSAANSLLKMLEEPPPDSFFVLVADRPTRLPPTIRSRCRLLEFLAPAREQALEWLDREGIGESAGLLLDLAGGAPLQALALARDDFLAKREQMLRDLGQLLSGRLDPVTAAARWKGLGTGPCLGWLSGFIADLIRQRSMRNDGASVLANPEASRFLQDYKNVLDLNKLFLFLDAVSEAKNGVDSGSLDELLLLEDVLIRWCQIAAGAHTIKTRAAS